MKIETRVALAFQIRVLSTWEFYLLEGELESKEEMYKQSCKIWSGELNRKCGGHHMGSLKKKETNQSCVDCRKTPLDLGKWKIKGYKSTITMAIDRMTFHESWKKVQKEKENLGVGSS